RSFTSPPTVKMGRPRTITSAALLLSLLHNITAQESVTSGVGRWEVALRLALWERCCLVIRTGSTSQIQPVTSPGNEHKPMSSSVFVLTDSLSPYHMREFFERIERIHFLSPGTPGHGFDGYLDTNTPGPSAWEDYNDL